MIEFEELLYSIKLPRDYLEQQAAADNGGLLSWFSQPQKRDPALKILTKDLPENLIGNLTDKELEKLQDRLVEAPTMNLTTEELYELVEKLLEGIQKPDMIGLADLCELVSITSEE